MHYLRDMSSAHSETERLARLVAEHDAYAAWCAAVPLHVWEDRVLGAVEAEAPATRVVRKVQAAKAA